MLNVYHEYCYHSEVIMTYMKPIFGSKILTMMAVGCASLTLTSCTTAYEEQSYAEEECEELKRAARQKFANSGSYTYGSGSEKNNILATLFQSDENRQKTALRKNYLDRCKSE